jgi:hypothetical protein
MRNTLAVLGAAVVTFLVIGYFLNWYKIHPTPDHQVTIDVNAPKIVNDVKKESQEIANHLQDKKEDGTPPAPPAPPGASPMPSAPNAVTVVPSPVPNPAPAPANSWVLH